MVVVHVSLKGMEALRGGAPEAVNGVSVEAEHTEASPSSSVAMKNNSSCCQEGSEGRNNDTVFSRNTESVPVNHQDRKSMKTCSSTPSEAPYSAVQSEEENYNLSAETIEMRGMKTCDSEVADDSSFKPAADSPFPTTCPNLVAGDNVPKTEEDETERSDSEALLLGLPADSLHAMASFLTPNEFCNFALCSQSSARICREIFRRVRMHAFRCATEVVTAWVSKSKLVNHIAQRL